MAGSPQILEIIRDHMPTYSNAERRVADTVLAKPNAVIHFSIAKLAREAGVSEPTVVRFCRILGFEGFKEFKLRLAQGLVAGTDYVHQEVKPGDDAATYIKRIGLFAVNGLSGVVRQLDPVAVEQAVATLAGARRIEFYGFGASAAVAVDAHHKFFRLGIPCNAYSDSHMQAMSASTLGPGEVVVAISHTGRSRELIESVRLARTAGGVVIGITTSDSPLAQECSQVLAVDLHEDTDVFTPMLSRLAHLLLIDILVVGVSLLRGEQVTDRLQRMKKALSLKRLRGVGDDQHD